VLEQEVPDRPALEQDLVPEQDLVLERDLVLEQEVPDRPALEQDLVPEQEVPDRPVLEQDLVLERDLVPERDLVLEQEVPDRPALEQDLVPEQEVPDRPVLEQDLVLERGAPCPSVLKDQLEQGSHPALGPPGYRRAEQRQMRRAPQRTPSVARCVPRRPLGGVASCDPTDLPAVSVCPPAWIPRRQTANNTHLPPGAAIRIRQSGGKTATPLQRFFL
jgi:hypothetical protein